MEKSPRRVTHHDHDPGDEPDFIEGTAVEIEENDTQTSESGQYEYKPSTEIVVLDRNVGLEVTKDESEAETSTLPIPFTPPPLPAKQKNESTRAGTTELKNNLNADARKKEVQVEIDEADKILSRYRRAKALGAIATRYNSVEAAERILSPSRFRNPFRAPGSDKYEHDIALKQIANKMNSREAAEKIKRGYHRNQVLRKLGKGAIARSGAESAVAMANEMHGADQRVSSKELISDAALSFDKNDIELAARLVKDEIKNPFARDKIFYELAVKHKDRKILQEITNPHTRSRARIKLSQT